MYQRRLPILALILSVGAGCAGQPDIPQDAELAVTDEQPAPQFQDKPTVRAEQDLRYRLPPARHRALTIYLGSQTFEYVEDDRVVVSGKISSGNAEHPTPVGDFRVLSKDINKRSGKYTNYFDENTPMPYSLQFSGPYFVHEGWVPGYADSHGCVRLHYEDARLLFHRIKVGDRVLLKPQGSARTANPWPDLFPVF